MENIKIENKGTIRLNSKVMVSDPCYGLNTWCQGIVKNLLPGTYDCFVEYSNEGDWGTRVSAIEVRHAYYDGPRDFYPEDFEVGVDSGQAGIFDYEYYEKYHSDCKERYHVDDSWYDRACDKTREYITNPDYIPFTNTTEYKAGLLAYHNALEELSKKYPELDTMSVYMDLVNEYHALKKEKPSLDFDSLIKTLSDLNKILENKECPNEVLEVTTQALEKAKGETELFDVKCEYERKMHRLWLAYRDSLTSLKKIDRFTGNTIDNLGFVSSSGYGDGGYTCWIARDNNGKVIAIRVEYITEDEDEDDEI